MRGMSLVELMVGIAIGLLIVAAATCVVVNQLHDHRRLMLETQIQQDLRSAADIIVRELRRSGYWGSAQRSAWFRGTPAVGSNPYAGAALTGDELAFSYSRDALTPSRGSENDRIDDNEASGLRLRNGAIELQLGDHNWQQLTDPTVLRITRLSIEPQVQQIDLSAFCAHPCPSGESCARLEVRAYDIEIEAQAVADASVRRSLRASVRTRNDAITGSCPR
jgi:type IV pilus assembly protein PilW